jgi:iron-sulfur cluster insertion protein
MEVAFFISANAARHIKKILESEAMGSRLRVSVKGGGCSGFLYNFLIDSETTPDDKIFTKDDIEVVTDFISLGLLNGSELDYAEDLSGARFVIKNPNAASACGCGNSFSI